MTYGFRTPFRNVLAEADGKSLSGTWLMAGTPTTAEALAELGFRFLVIDMEHVPISVSDVLYMLRTLAPFPVSPIVRLPSHNPILVKQLLDIGAVNLMFPFVNDAETAECLVKAMRYPPEGIRGAAAVHRGSRYATIDGYFRAANDALTAVVQIETQMAVNNVRQISGTSGVDAVFIGPGDLSVNLGHPGDVFHEEVQSAIDGVFAVCHDVGKPCGIVAPTQEAAADYLARGASYVAISSDMGLMIRAARAIFSGFGAETA